MRKWGVEWAAVSGDGPTGAGGGMLLETKTNIFNKIQRCTANLQLLGKTLISLGIPR